MANQKLFLSNTVSQFTAVGNSLSTQYKFDGKELTIKWKNEEKVVKANLGDAFFIGCYGSFPKIKPLRTPRGKGQKLLWLCGFSRYNRAISKKEFENKKEKWLHEFNWWGFNIKCCLKTENAQLELCNRQDCGGVYHFASYANNDITKVEIIKIIEHFWKIGRIYFPKEYIEVFCKKHFDVKIDL